MSHPFIVGKTYRNRHGEYVVVAIDAPQMTIRYVDGGMLETNVQIQGRIWENIQAEEQLAREEERQRLAREARVTSRRRETRTRQARTRKPRFTGFQESDFQRNKRGLAWSSREEVGKAVAHELGQRTEETFGHWTVPRQSEVHVARDKHYDREARDKAAFFVAVDEEGVSYGLLVSKPEGKAKVQQPWARLVEALAADQEVRKALRAAMKEQELSLDVYAENKGYRQVGQITVQERAFLWQQGAGFANEAQPETRRMNWTQLADYLQTEVGDKRSELRLRKYLVPDAALKAGASVPGLIAEELQALLSIYETVTACGSTTSEQSA